MDQHGYDPRRGDSREGDAYSAPNGSAQGPAPTRGHCESNITLFMLVGHADKRYSSR